MPHNRKKGNVKIRVEKREKTTEASRDVRRQAERERATGKTEKKRETKKEPVIKLEKKKGFVQKAKDIITSPKTTVALAATLATGGAAGIAGAAARTTGKAVITRTATSIGSKPLTLTTQRAFVGKSAKSGIDKVFHKTREVATRFGSNKKSAGLTTSLFKKILKVGTSPAVLLASIGTYPFAGFIKEEAVQQTGFAFNEAERNNDLEGMETAIQETEDILNAAPSILDKIPFVNVLNQLKGYFEAVAVKLATDKRVLEKKRGELSGEIETEFEKSQSEARQTQLEQRSRDAEYFNLIREGKFEEAQELLDSELQ